MVKKHLFNIVALLSAFAVEGAESVVGGSGQALEGENAPPAVIEFDAGADLRIRQEIMHNVPSMQNGMIGRPGVSRGKTRNQMRFRPRVWAQLRFGENWRLYSRLADEIRAGIAQPEAVHASTWPGEVVVDNLFLEGKGLFDGAIDLLVGRRDIYRLYGLDHIFIDGTSGDGSRSVYADMVTLTWHANEDSTLDVFGIFNKDREYMRLGTHRSYEGMQLTGFGGNDTEMDDWGWGAIWGSRVDLVKYQLIGIQKNTASFHRNGVKHPRRQVNMLGVKIDPCWTDNLSTPLELYGQLGRNGENSTLSGWAAYTGIHWRDNDKETMRPFFETGLLALSGDRHAVDEDGGHHGWDPMWYRGVNDSEMFLYGSTYGVGWWSNMYNFKTRLGVEIAPKHSVAFQSGPMFAVEQDHGGGGSGMFKGYLNQVRYDFPLWKGREDGACERFEIFGHLLFEHFAPGDYYETGKPAYFVRWQVDFKF